MNLNKFTRSARHIVVLAVGTGLFISGGVSTSFALNAGQPVKGSGILQSKKANSVTLFVQHANSGKTLSTRGTFRAGLGWLSYDPSPRILMLNVYKLTRTKPTAAPTERLVYSAPMQEDFRVQQLVPDGQQDGATFSKELDEVTRAVGNLVGDFRAEAVAYVVPSTYMWDGKSAPESSYEVGAADVLFSAVDNVNLVPVTEVSGGISMSSEIAVNRNATKAQIDALYARNTTERNITWPQITQYFSKHSQSTPGAPSRVPWSFGIVSGGPQNPWTGTIGINLSKGQIYTSDRARVEREITALIKTGNRTITMPGGVIRLKVWGGLSYTDL